MSHLTQEQRYIIETLLKEKYSQTAIASRIGRDKSVVCREVKRNKDKRNGLYRASLAQIKCEKRHCYASSQKLVFEKNKIIYFTDEVKTYVDTWIKEDYSPEQVVGVARKEGINCVSHERIYQYLWKDKKQGGQLFKHLRTQGKTYRKRGAAKDKRGQIIGRIDIDQRPAIVDKKERLGDLEIDLITSSNGNLLTINDRCTNVCKIVKVNTKEALEVQMAINETLKSWKPFIKTITSDNGKEFANHQLVY
jgi:IS30 family transposase